MTASVSKWTEVELRCMKKLDTLTHIFEHMIRAQSKQSECGNEEKKRVQICALRMASFELLNPRLACQALQMH